MFGMPPDKDLRVHYGFGGLAINGILAIDMANVCRYTILHGERLP
jgi:hypothetical protein